jgi:hypothetical protein
VGRNVRLALHPAVASTTSVSQKYFQLGLSPFVIEHNALTWSQMTRRGFRACN